VLEKRLSLLSLVEANLITKLIHAKLASEVSEDHKFVLFDSFPRNVQSALAIQEVSCWVCVHGHFRMDLITE
jgi:adenylate kinase family enzyme